MKLEGQRRKTGESPKGLAAPKKRCPTETVSERPRSGIQFRKLAGPRWKREMNGQRLTEKKKKQTAQVAVPI